MQADTGEAKGEEAALDIVTWDKVAMEIQYACTVKKKGIEMPLAEILMEGFRIKDEKETVEGKEGKMDIKKLNKIIEDLKEDCGDGLLATDIWATADGQIITGHNSNPKAAALAARQREHINQALIDSKFPELDRYFLFHLKGDLVVMNISLGDYMWGVLFDEKKVQLGLILNVVLPKTLDAFQEAVAG
jgi:hypothetical protein